MATRKLSLFKLLRRRHHLLRSISSSSYDSPSSSIETLQSGNTSHRCLPSHSFFKRSGVGFSTTYKFSSESSCYRSFSTRRDAESDGPKNDGMELSESGFFDYDDGGGAAAKIAGEVSVAAGSGGGEEAILPVRCLVWYLDGIHHLTGLPWWIVIIISTLALRIAVLPILLVQLRKLKRNAELAPQLPPPLPPPFSGKSWIEQYKRFRDKRKEIGCPSFLWLLAYPCVQIPCLVLGTISIRGMALDHHSGFDCGGILWFQNLSELPHGVSGFIFPLSIAALHLINVQVSFEKSSLKSLPNVIGTLAKYYKYYLQSLTIPILIGGFYLPQGSLLYWATNSSLTLIQQLALKNPYVREKLGLPEKLVPEDSGKSQELDGLEATLTVPMVEKPIQDLSLLELFKLSIKHLSKGDQDKAVVLLRLVLDKDPEYVRALIVMGQILMKKERMDEATDYLERAITKLLLIGHPTEVEEIDHLILASTWAGVAYSKQGKVEKGIIHLERIANMKEPDDQKAKTHYCDGLFMLSSALASAGRNAEAAKYLRILTTYDPAYGAYLKDVESTDENFADDLENSRRKDY